MIMSDFLGQEINEIILIQFINFIKIKKKIIYSNGFKTF